MPLKVGTCRPGFLSPFGHRHSLLGHPLPARDLGLPCGRLTGQSRTPTGLPRSTHPRCDRGGRPLYPDNDGVPTAGVSFPDRRLAAFQRPGCSTPLLIPSNGAQPYEASTKGSHVFARPVFPLPVAACGMERRRLGVDPELRTPPLPVTHVRAGTGHGTLTRSSTYVIDNLQSVCSLEMCDFVSHVG